MIVGTCWYLAGLLLLISLAASAITVVPGHGVSTAGIVAGTAVGSLVFALAAIILHTREWRWIQQSKPIRNVFLGFAALMTMSLLLSVG
jgi:hypothetical protein